MNQVLIQALQNPAVYPHETADIRVIETHISTVILTGPHAYKIKKPVNFGFLDFTSLEARRHFCHEEVRLNQRLTRGLYLDVIAITGSPEAPRLGGDGEVLEYAIRMRQFPQEQLLDRMLQRGELGTREIDALTRQIARFHLEAPVVAQGHPLAQPGAIMAPVRQNFEQIRPLLSEKRDLQQLDALESWAEDSFQRLLPLLEQRCQNGSIRECHGDIHLGNATVLDGEVVLFDCIEFNEPFRLIDIACDAFFLAMDLEDRGQHALAHRFTNNWLEQTGDYGCLPLINFYKAYRAMVRAKVNLFRLGQESDPAVQAEVLQQYRSYTRLAESYCAIPARFLAITHGVSACGKSTVAMQLVEGLGALRLRSDVERKRLFGQQQVAGNPLHAGIYSAELTIQTYQRLHQQALAALQAGFSVVIDATYLKHEQRQQAASVAGNCGVPLLILDCQAPDAAISQWLAERQAAGVDPSDATAEVVAAQQASREPLTAEEQQYSQAVLTNEAASMEKLVEQIRSRLPE